MNLLFSESAILRPKNVWAQVRLVVSGTIRVYLLRRLLSLSLFTLTFPLLSGCHRSKPSVPYRAFAGHTNYINGVAFSSDGKMLATASADRSVKLWDVATGTETRTLAGHTEVVDQVAFSSDGRMLASAGWDHTVRLWNPDTGSPLRTLSGHNLAVLSVAFSPDGKRIAGGSSDNTVTIWDAQTGKLLKTLPDVQNPVAFSPDGSLLATGTAAHALKIWSVPHEAGKAAKWEVRQTLTGHIEALESAAFSPDGKMIGTGSADTDALLWNVGNWLEANRLRLHLGVVHSITFSPDSKMFLAGAGRVVQFYDAQTGAILKTLQTPFSIVNGIALSHDGKTLAVVGTFKTAADPAADDKKPAEATNADREVEKKVLVYVVRDIFAQ